MKTLYPTINLSQREAVILALVTTAKNLRTIADELPEADKVAGLCRVNADANDKLADEIKASRPAPERHNELREALRKLIVEGEKRAKADWKSRPEQQFFGSEDFGLFLAEHYPELAEAHAALAEQAAPTK